MRAKGLHVVTEQSCQAHESLWLLRSWNVVVAAPDAKVLQGHGSGIRPNRACTCMPAGRCLKPVRVLSSMATISASSVLHGQPASNDLSFSTRDTRIHSRVRYRDTYLQHFDRRISTPEPWRWTFAGPYISHVSGSEDSPSKTQWPIS
jgi:hypothetical protein